MNLELFPIHESNRAAVEALAVWAEQEQYIAPNRKSLETAEEEEYLPIARPFAISAEGKIVGFAMFAFELTSPDPKDRYWLWRFMIHKEFQGKGYGSLALEQIIAYFKAHGADHILLSTKGSNTTALSLYHKFLFTETGERNGDEIILRLEL